MERREGKFCFSFFFVAALRASTNFKSSVILREEGSRTMEKRKFVIHLDINGTIMPADPIRSKHVETMLNIHLSKQAFVRRRDVEDAAMDEIVWWTGSPFLKGDTPPLLPQFRYTCHINEHYEEEVFGSTGSYPIGESVSLQDFNAALDGEKCDDFTCKHSPGHVYEPELVKLLGALEWNHPLLDASITEALTLEMKDGRKMNLFVPAFLHLVQYLFEHRDEQDYVLVIRTFGSDIPRLIPAFKLIAQGLHPDIPTKGCIKEPHAYGSLFRDDTTEFTLQLESLTHEGERKIVVSSNQAVMEYFESLESGSVVLICDDYETWKRNKFDPIFGKPIFLDLESAKTCRHFLLDDNVNTNPKDSIAAVWLKEEGCFRPVPLSSARGKAMIGTVMLQASLYFAILFRDSFVEELQRANSRYDSLALRLEKSV